MVKAYVRGNRLEDALEFTKRSPFVNEVLLSTLLGGLIATNRGHMATRVFEVFRQAKFVPNSLMLDKLLICCEQSRNGPWARQLLDEAIGNGVELTAVHYSSYIGAVVLQEDAPRILRETIQTMNTAGLRMTAKFLTNAFSLCSRNNEFDLAASLYWTYLAPYARKNI